MLPFERALATSYRPSIVTFPLSLRVSEILPLICSHTRHFFPTSPLVSPKFSHVPLGVGGSPFSYKERRCWANCPCNYFPRFPTYVITKKQRYMGCMLNIFNANCVTCDDEYFAMYNVQDEYFIFRDKNAYNARILFSTVRYGRTVTVAVFLLQLLLVISHSLGVFFPRNIERFKRRMINFYLLATSFHALLFSPVCRYAGTSGAS